MADLEGKVAVVTGASTPHGIGRAIARRFAREQARVLLVADRTEEQLEDAARECRELAGDGNISSAIVDLGVPGQPEAMIEKALAAFGRIDVLVNNAALRAPYDFGEYRRATFDRMISVNLAAAFFASQAALGPMRAQGGGRIIHVTSQLAQVVAPQRALYGLTKAALVNLTKSMAFELCRDNIVVNALSPGPIATEPLKDMGLTSMRELYEGHGGAAAPKGDEASWNDDLLDRVPIGRLGEVEEIAEVALYLAARSPAFLMGQEIVVDGGYVLR